MAAYQVKLPVFEGPFDLLFHLIEEQKLNIYDIPIAQVTANYLEYLQMMESLDMEVASSFLVMAATLLEIKSRMLLPKMEVSQEDFDSNEFGDGEMSGEEARQALVAKLLEYRRFKLMALELREMERKASRIFTRTLPYDPKPEEILQIQVGANDLLKLFQALIGRRSNPPVHRVVIDQKDLTERINEIKMFLSFRKGKVDFLSLLPPEKTRRDIITSFLAILEMVKSGQIALTQSNNFQPIFLKRVEDEDSNQKAVG